MFDPKVGRWTTQDPLGFNAGDTNLYRYVGNATVNVTDPGGLFGIFFDGTWQSTADNDMIQKLHDSYTGPMDDVYHFNNLGAPPARFLNWSWDVLSKIDPSSGYRVAESTDPWREVMVNVETSLASIKRAHQANPNEPIDLFGYSRGGMAAIILANKLKSEHIPVRYLGVIDPSDTWSGLPSVTYDASRLIPDNVSTVYLGYGAGKDKSSRQQFENGFVTTYTPLIQDATTTTVIMDSFPIGHLGLSQDPRVIGGLVNSAHSAGIDQKTLPR